MNYFGNGVDDSSGYVTPGNVLNDIGLSKSTAKRLTAQVEAEDKAKKKKKPARKAKGPSAASKKAIVEAALKKLRDDSWARYQRREDLTNALLRNLKAKMPVLEEKLAEYTGHWNYEDPIYRFYHGSYKAYYLQDATRDIVGLLASCGPDSAPMNEDFKRIFEEGTRAGGFKMEYNRDWHGNTRPIVEAFLHAKYFLEMAVKYGKELEEPANCLPSGWAGLLYFYNLR